KTIFGGKVLALGKAGLFQALCERGDVDDRVLRRPGAEKSDHRQCLGARSQRPRQDGGRRYGCRCNEFAPFHSITSSAEASNAVGNSRPSAFAVLRLTTSSNIVGCCTGKSDGLIPLRTCPT